MKVLPTTSRPPRRRDERDRRPLVTHPGRSATVFVVALLAAAAIPITAVWGLRSLANSREGEVTVVQNVPGDNIVELVLPDTAGALLVAVDRENVAVGLTVFAPRPDGGGTVLIVPTTAASTGADGAEIRLGDAYAAGGLAAQTEAVEDLLGVTLATSAEVRQGDLAELLRPYAPFTVTLTDRVVDTDDGEDETLAEPATRDLTADDAAAVLMARKEGESELARLPRTVEVWKAVLPGTASAPVEAPTASTLAPEGASVPAGPTTVPQFLAAVAAAPGNVSSLPARSRTAADGGEVFDITPEYIHLLMAQVLPGAVSPANDFARVRLIEPGADPTALLAATQKIDALPANLILAASGGETQSPAVTVLRYGNPVGEAAARALAASGAFGPAPQVLPTDQPFGGIDLTVVVGKDFAPAVEAYKAAAAANPPTSPKPQDEDED